MTAAGTARAEFEDCEIIVDEQTTTLRATLPDQAALAGLIERLLALHCELVRVVRLPPHQQNGSPPRAGKATPASDGEPALAQFAFGMVNRLFSGRWRSATSQAGNGAKAAVRGA